MGRAATGWLVQGVVLAGLTWPAQAAALPLLRLYMDGDVDRMGAGGASVFRDLRAEALRLERPALLAGTQKVQLSVGLTNEEILSMHAGEWAGTEANDRKLDLTLVAPLSRFGGMPLVGFVSVRHEMGLLHLQRKGEGTLIRAEENRDVATVGLSTALPWGVSLGASLEGSGAGPGWLFEARYEPSPLVSAWYRRHDTVYDYRLTVPQGVANRINSPEIQYGIDNTIRETEIGAELGRPDMAWGKGGIQLESPNDYWAELGGRPVPWLAVRVGSDREIYRFDDSMQAVGTGTIATVDLGTRFERYFGGADFEIGDAGVLESRYVHSRLSAASRADEVGTAAARAFLKVDYDMGLFFRGGYRMEGDQVALGWSSRKSEGVDFSVGAQFLRLQLDRSDLAIQSNTLQRALATEEVRPAQIDMLGLTGAVHVPVGRFRLSAAVGQFVPVAMRQESTGGSTPPPDQPPSGGGGAKEPEGPYEWLTSSVGKLLDKLDKYGGGNRLLLRLTTEF